MTTIHRPPPGRPTGGSLVEQFEYTVRPDFWHLVDYATGHDVGVKFSTNGSRIDADVARRLASSDYVDVQISIDGATPEVNDRIREEGSWQTVMTAMAHLADAGFEGFKISVVVTRENVDQLDEFQALADEHAAQLRITRLRPAGRGADVWDELHPTAEQQRRLYDWLVARGDRVLTGDSFFHLSPYGGPLPGRNLCGGGSCGVPHRSHRRRLRLSVRDPRGVPGWQRSRPGRVHPRVAIVEALRRPAQPQTEGACTSCEFFESCRGGYIAAKFFTGLPLDGPDPECVRGFGEQALQQRDHDSLPRPSQDHSRGRSSCRW